MTGHAEDQVTYPTFIVPDQGRPLLILYRSGTATKGEARIKGYSEDDREWFDYPEPILSGAHQHPWTSNAYWNRPVVSRSGEIHLSFTWRTHNIPGSELVNNVNVGYAKSPDWGWTWFTSQDQPLQLPLTQVNSEVAWSVPPGSNLINQCGMDLDSQGYPHLVFYADDPFGVPQYQHVWFDGLIWRHSYASDRSRPFELTGRGTLELPISRPQLLIDRTDDSALLIHRGDETENRLSVTRLSSPGYELTGASHQVVDPEDLHASEPVIDFTRWEKDGVLSAFMLAADQPNGDLDVDSTYQSRARIIDLEM